VKNTTAYVPCALNTMPKKFLTLTSGSDCFANTFEEKSFAAAAIENFPRGVCLIKHFFVITDVATK
jgi:hypothetical protein